MWVSMNRYAFVVFGKVEKSEFLASNDIFLEDLVSFWEKSFKKRTNKEERESTNISFENLELIEDNWINIKIPGLPLQSDNSPVEFQ